MSVIDDRIRSYADAYIINGIDGKPTPTVVEITDWLPYLLKEGVQLIDRGSDQNGAKVLLFHGQNAVRIFKQGDQLIFQFSDGSKVIGYTYYDKDYDVFHIQVVSKNGTPYKMNVGKNPKGTLGITIGVKQNAVAKPIVIDEQHQTVQQYLLEMYNELLENVNDDASKKTIDLSMLLLMINDPRVHSRIRRYKKLTKDEYAIRSAELSAEIEEMYWSFKNKLEEVTDLMGAQQETTDAKEIKS